MTTTTTAPNVIATMLAQIGRMNVLAISGGRVRYVDDDTIMLPVRYGYRVVVGYNAGSDLYTVTRIFVRGGKTFVKKVWDGVYASDLGNIAYLASCYLDD